MDTLDLKAYIKKPSLLGKDTIEGIKNLTEKYPYFETAWILYIKNLKVINHPKYKSELKKVAIRISDRRKLYHFLHPENGSPEFILNVLSKSSVSEIGDYPINDFAGDKKESISKNSLIDSFIAAQPSMKLNANEEEPLPDNNISLKSEEENDEIITETLAKIFVDQKKYDKAIEAFEKLCLKFPEKNSYFAAQIDEINKIKNE